LKKAELAVIMSDAIRHMGDVLALVDKAAPTQSLLTKEEIEHLRRDANDLHKRFAFIAMDAYASAIEESKDEFQTNQAKRSSRQD